MFLITNQKNADTELRVVQDIPDKESLLVGVIRPGETLSIPDELASKYWGLRVVTRPLPPSLEAVRDLSGAYQVQAPAPPHPKRR